MTAPLDPSEARDLLAKAGQLGAASQAGAGWPQIALLLGLGGVSAMFMVALHLVVQVDKTLVWLPMVVMGVWLSILFITVWRFSRATKVGFGRRWRRVTLAWGVIWVVSMVGGTVWWQGQLWFTIVSVLLLTTVTTWGAWREARR